MANSAGKTTAPATVTSRRSVGWWLAYGSVILAVVTSAAFGALSLLSPTAFLGVVGVRPAQVNASVEVFASYTGARELAIACTLLVLLLSRAPRGLAGAMLLTGLANMFDFAQAMLSQRWFQAPGALVFAIIYLSAATWLFNRSARHGTC